MHNTLTLAKIGPNKCLCIIFYEFLGHLPPIRHTQRPLFPGFHFNRCLVSDQDPRPERSSKQTFCDLSCARKPCDTTYNEALMSLSPSRCLHLGALEACLASAASKL